MMSRTIIIILTALLCSAKGVAQNVNVDAKIDSLHILVGDQTDLDLSVTVNPKSKVDFPLYTDTIVKGINVVNVSKVDTQYLNNNQRMVLSKHYTVTSFDSALYYIPPIEVMVDGEPYQSQNLALKVSAFPVDTLHVDKFFGPKTIMEVPFLWSDWYMAIAAFLSLIPILVLLIYLFKRYRDDKPIIRKVKVEPKIPAYKIAIEEFDRIKEEKLWQKIDAKEYYTKLTDVIRNYISERYEFNALEMTSSEIIDKLLEKEGKEALKDIRLMFETADLVKFAKHNPDITEKDANLINAIDFIDETKQEVEDEESLQPKEITIVEKRTLRTKILLILTMVVLAVAGCAAVIYIAQQFYNYF